MRIPLDTFEQVIDEKILDRGLKYFQSGAVDLVEELDTGYYEASVSGTENYTVRLRVTGKAITEYECDCPYDLGPVCKHVVAVIFHLKQDELGLKIRKPKGAKAPAKRKTVADQVHTILEKLDRADLDRFITAYCAEDRSFRTTFLAEFAQHSGGHTKATYVKQLKSLLRGKDHWDMARPLSITANKLLDRARKHIAAEQAETAHVIATAVAEESVKALQSVDDSNGYLGDTINATFQLLRVIADQGHSIRPAVVDYCLTAHGKEVFNGWDWHTTCLEIAVEHAQGAAEIERAHAALDNDELDGYDQRQAAKLKVKLLLRTEGEPAAELYMMRHLHIPEVRVEAIHLAITRKDLHQATRLAEEAIAHDHARDGARGNGPTPGYVSGWTEQLLEIALAEKDRERIIEHARALFLGGLNMDRGPFYAMLKAHVSPSEWSGFADGLIKDIRSHGRFCDFDLIAMILVREERWADLAKALLGTTHYARIEQYEKHLTKDHAAEVAELYLVAVRHNMTNAGGRSHYQQAARCIRRMIKLGQREKAEALVAELRAKYPQRTALMAELDKV